MTPAQLTEIRDRIREVVAKLHTLPTGTVAAVEAVVILSDVLVRLEDELKGSQ